MIYLSSHPTYLFFCFPLYPLFSFPSSSLLLSFLSSPLADGWLQRVVILGSEAHVIEEIQLFDSPQPVDSLTISHTKVTLNAKARGFPHPYIWSI